MEAGGHAASCETDDSEPSALLASGPPHFNAPSFYATTLPIGTPWTGSPTVTGTALGVAVADPVLVLIAVQIPRQNGLGDRRHRFHVGRTRRKVRFKLV